MSSSQSETINPQQAIIPKSEANVEPEVWLRTRDAKAAYFLTTQDLVGLPSRIEEPKDGKKAGRRPVLYSSHVLLELAHSKHGKDQFEKMKQKRQSRKRKSPSNNKATSPTTNDSNVIKTLSATLLKMARSKLAFPAAPGEVNVWKVELAFCERRNFNALMSGGGGGKEKVKEKDGVFYKTVPATFLFRCQKDQLKRKEDQEGRQDDVSVSCIIDDSVTVRYHPDTMTLTLQGSTRYEFDL